MESEQNCPQDWKDGNCHVGSWSSVTASGDLGRQRKLGNHRVRLEALVSPKVACEGKVPRLSYKGNLNVIILLGSSFLQQLLMLEMRL